MTGLRRKFTTVTLAGLLVLGGAACSDDSGTETEATEAATEAGGAATEAATEAGGAATEAATEMATEMATETATE